MESDVIFEVQQLFVKYGAILAVDGLSLRIRQGEIVCLLGANGAGKTSSLLAISNLIPSLSRSMLFLGQDVRQRNSAWLVSHGLVQVPEGRLVLAQQTVDDNLRLGGFVDRRDRYAKAQTLGEVYDFFPKLKERRKQLAGTLSGGEQQMLAIGRALMARPKLLLLDEPSLGLAPLVVDLIYEKLKTLQQQGLSLLLVEQNAELALQIADRAYVLESGRLILQGQARELRQDERIAEAYLGGS